MGRKRNVGRLDGNIVEQMAENLVPKPDGIRRHTSMKLNKLIYRLKPPCPKCPYTLGLVRTVVNPCPGCRADGYRTFGRFRERWTGNRHGTGGKEA